MMLLDVLATIVIVFIFYFALICAFYGILRLVLALVRRFW